LKLSRQTLLEVGLRNAVKENLCTETDNAAKLRIISKLQSAIDNLAKKSEHKNYRPWLFFFTGLLLDRKARYQISPMSGFTRTFISFSPKNWHLYLLKTCESYGKLNNSLDRPFKPELPDEDTNRYFKTIWLDIENSNAYLRKKFDSDSIVLDSVIATNGKEIHISFIDKQKPKTGDCKR